MDNSRLIEHAFPLRQTSIDSVHEKNVRHGHISTLHIWPARRPLAACRAALIATLLPDPGTAEKRRELCEKIGGTLIKKIERKKMPGGKIVEREKEETVGGILHWGRETKNAEDLQWFREEIRKAYGGRAPRVLDPFAGGGAIPLEAMRLGCEVTAIDINPVAWFVLKCTLEYPQKLAGKTHPLPDFILENEEFMEAFYKAHPHFIGRTKKTKKQKIEEHIAPNLFEKADSDRAPKADLAWHVRAWGQWVLDNARKELAQYYPTYADFEPIDKKNGKSYEKQPMQLVSLKKNGIADICLLNKGFSKDYLYDNTNPRWIAKPTVAYLWARTVTCKNCRAVLPLLKTRWLCKKDKKRVLLTVEPNVDKTGVVFGIQNNVPEQGGNTAQKRELDKKIGAGTMSRSGAKCPCCPTIMTMEDIRVEGQAGRLSNIMTAIAIEGLHGKEYRPSEALESTITTTVNSKINELFSTDIPFGLPMESTPKGGNGASRAFSVDGYGFDQWHKMFSPRQLLSIGTLVKITRESSKFMADYSVDWKQGLISYLTSAISRTTDYMASFCVWENGAEEIKHVFMRWALPITWDFAEGNILAPIERFYRGGIGSIYRILNNLHSGNWSLTIAPKILNNSVIAEKEPNIDLVITDPPYYDAIPYSDCMDFFYIWLRRTLSGLLPESASIYSNPLSPKWNHETNDGELIDDANRHSGDRLQSKKSYEDGMFRAFLAISESLKSNGRLVIVFAHKHPDAWETLVSAIIRAGFVVDGSWPIQTEMPGGIRNLRRASLSSSVWLVCKKRPIDSKPGWDNNVLEEMRANIGQQLREFWDAGIRGPDFVWAATGPALEAYSKHPVVKKANEPGSTMAVSEFLNHVRRIVVDFVVGRVLSGDKAEENEASTDRLDETTAYYLLHRHDFGLDDAPAGSCILYAVSCGLSDKELADTWDIISFTKGDSNPSIDEDEEKTGNAEIEVEEVEESSGSKVKLKQWSQRKSKSLGYEAPGGKPIPLIDRIHRLMHLWKAGDVHKIDEYLDEYGLRRHELFKRLLQSLIELSSAGSEERSLLESLSNHVGAKGAVRESVEIKLDI